MYRIENLEHDRIVLLKKSNYISIIADEVVFSNKICEAIYDYYSNKKGTGDKKVMINNSETGEREQISSKFPIFISDNNLDSEVELGVKTVMYQRVLDYLKEKYPIEPVFLTLNTIMESFFLEEVTENFKKEFSIHSDYNLEFEFKDFSPVEIAKKIEVKYFLDSKEQPIDEISNYEKLKLEVSLHEIKEKIETREKIYIFYYPERLLSISEIKRLKIFLSSLIQDKNIIVVATNSKYLLGDTLDSINIFKNKKLLSFEKDEELGSIFLENYPVLKEWSYIRNRLLFLIKNYFIENYEDIRITNKIKNDIDELYLQSFEDIFIFVFYLKQLGLEYGLDIDYDETSVFSNYIKKYF